MILEVNVYREQFNGGKNTVDFHRQVYVKIDDVFK